MSPVAEEKFRGKRLVIFGCGYVGSAAASRALAQGMRVTALTRNATRADELRRAGAQVVIAALDSDLWYDEVGNACDLALNCVSAASPDLDGYRRSYVGGMQSIATWVARGVRLESFVYTSSTSVYPQGDGAVVDEDAPTAAAAERGQLLLEAERLAFAAGAAAGAETFVLRLAGIYGPGRHSLLEQVRTGVVSGRGEHRLNLIHRDDIVDALWACWSAPAGAGNACFNLADDAPTPKAEVAAWIAARLGVPPPRFTGEPAGTRRAVTPNRIIANGRAKSRLGWSPRHPSFRDGYATLLSR